MANTAPNAPGLVSPIGSVTLDYANVNRFSWLFSDPDAGDTQSAYDLQYRIIAALSWVTISATTPNNFYDMPAGTLTAANYEWQVRTYDSTGTVGPWSASSFFSAATAPSTLSITAPTSGSNVTNLPTFTWSTPNQSSYQLRRCADIAGAVDTSTVYWDSGEVVAVATRSATITMDTNNRNEWLQVRVKYSGLWSAWVGVRVLSSFTQPSPGVVTIAALDSSGAVVITTTAAPVLGGEPTPISVDLYVKIAGTVGFGDRIAKTIFPTGTFIWWIPVSGVLYEVRSLTTADNGTQRWSAYTYIHSIDGSTVTPATYTMILDGGTPTTLFSNSVDGGTP